MSDVVLSASVRQNLLSLQSTAELLATTQNRLATGKKVNSALDNPTNYFTAASLDSRASDINNLLDGIGNGVQVLQAANTGITSLQKLIDSAKSVANQALQTNVGFVKSKAVSTAIPGATANNLLATFGGSSSTVAGSLVTNNNTLAYVATPGAPGAAQSNNHTGAVTGNGIAQSSAALTVPSTMNVDTVFTGNGALTAADTTTPVTGTTKLRADATSSTTAMDVTALDGKTLSVNGHNITFSSTPGTPGISGDNTTGWTVDISSTSNVSMDDLLGTIDTAMGNADATNPSVVNGGKIELHTGDGTTGVNLNGSLTADLTVLGINTLNDGTATPVDPTAGALTLDTGVGPNVNIGPTTKLSDIGITNGQSVVINGKSITFSNTATTAPSANGSNIDLTNGTVTELLSAINGVFGSAAGHGTASLGTGSDAGKIVLDGGAGADLTVADGATTGALSALGLPAGPQNRTYAAPGTPTAVTGATKLTGTASPTSNSLSTASQFTATDTITVNSKTLTFHAGSGTTGSIATGDLSIGLADGSVQDVLNAINQYGGGTAAIDPTSGAITLTTGTAANLSVSGAAGTLAKLGLADPLNVTRNSTTVTGAAITDATTLTGAVGTNSLAAGSQFTTADTIVVNSHTIGFYDSGAGPAPGTPGTTYIDIATAKVSDVLDAIDAASGGSGSAIVNGRATLVASTLDDLNISGSGLAKLGLSPGVTTKSSAATAGLDGLTLDIAATGSSHTSTHIVFGDDDSLGEVSTLDELNAKLSANNLQASISTAGKITLTTTNDSASSDVGMITGTATDPGNAFAGVTVDEAVTDPDSQATRAGLVAQYNNIIDQIRTTAQDASFNGVNLLSGDQLKLVFNETGTSQLNITGTALDPAGLGLGTLAKGTDFIDNASTNQILTSLNAASSMLRSQASTLGSNLSIVQIRQDFSKNLINVLQTGSANLTIADTNEEAANSQALATRQSIAVSALALANQSQQSVLKLLQ